MAYGFIVGFTKSEQNPSILGASTSEMQLETQQQWDLEDEF